MNEADSLKLALDYIDRHLGLRYLFPIKPGAKFPPCLKDNLDGNCSNDPAQIRKWSRQFPGCNWGLAHKKSAVMVVDVDTNPKKGKKGQATFDELELAYGWPDTEKTTTPSGGFHLIYEGPHITALGKNGFGLDIDSPNYTLIAGCSFADGTSYVGNDLEAVKAPEWFYTVIKSAKTKARISNADEVVVELDQAANVDLAVDYLQEDAEPAIEGSGGDFNTYKAAAYLKDIGISRERAVDLLNEYYNPRCEPPWDREGLERKVNSAYTYSNLSKVGGKTAEADFGDDAPEFDKIPDIGTWNPKTKKNEKNPERAARQANTRNTNAAVEAAKPADPTRPNSRPKIIANWVWVVGMKRWINKTDPAKNNDRDVWDVTSFDSEYNRIICKDRGSASDNLLRMTKGGPASYYRVGFKPGQPQSIDNGQTFNVYRTPDVQDIEGDLTWWQGHLDYLFPDVTYQNHLLNWMAWLVQNIAEKPKHALIIQGEENGTGKSFIGKVLTKILHPANVAVVPQNGLSGRFNSWALQCKLIVVEELRAADRAAVKEALHDIITEDIIAIEKKGVDPIKVENCFGVMGFTNDDAAVTLDNTDRRYLIVRTDARRRSGEYYTGLFAKLADPAAINAVYASLMKRDLLSVGYSGQQAAPFTAAKAAMLAASASEIDLWLNDHMDQFPLNMRLVQVEDVIPYLPKGFENRNPRRSIRASLLKKFGGEEMGQVRLPDGKRVRLIAINGSAGIMRNNMDSLGKIYLADLKAKGKDLETDVDEANADFAD